MCFDKNYFNTWAFTLSFVNFLIFFSCLAPLPSLIIFYYVVISGFCGLCVETYSMTFFQSLGFHCMEYFSIKRKCFSYFVFSQFSVMIDIFCTHLLCFAFNVFFASHTISGCWWQRQKKCFFSGRKRLSIIELSFYMTSLKFYIMHRFPVH